MSQPSAESTTLTLCLPTHHTAAAAPASTIPDNLATAPSLGQPRAKLLKKHPLLYPVLEGLAIYTHLISVEYFNDIMDVFHQVCVCCCVVVLLCACMWCVRVLCV